MESKGAQIRRARLGTGMTQNDLAEQIGVTGATISNWENNEVEPQAAKLSRLEKLLGITLNDTGETEVADGESLSAFAAWLIEARTAKGWAVPLLAESSGVSVAQIYNIERGRSANPQAATRQKLSKALGTEVPEEVSQETERDAQVADIGEMQDFDPYDRDSLPHEPGVYVLYDVSDRPIYVGQSQDIGKRILDHEQSFWFKRPIVENGAYLKVADGDLRKNLEKTLIKFLKSNAVINQQHVDH